MAGGERGAASSGRPHPRGGEGCVLQSPREHHSASGPLISTPQLQQHPNERGVASKTDFKHAHGRISIHVHCIGLEPCAPLHSK